MIPLFKVFMNPDAGSEVTEVLNSGYIGQGQKVEEFEKELQDYFQTPYVLTVNSATSGLTLAFRLSQDNACQWIPSVATTPLTCTATNWAILAANREASINWVDVDPNNCNMCLDDLEAQLTEYITAVCVVHWGGYPVDLDRLNYILDRHETKFGYRPTLIEDCAHAMGSTYQGKPLGTHGGIGVYSLQAIKHVTSVDGGIIVLPNKEMYDAAKLLRWYGLSRESSKDFRCEQDIPRWGYKFHMNDVNATIGMCNFKSMRDIVSRHVDNAMYLREKLVDMSDVHIMDHEKNKGICCAYWIFTILVEERDNLKRKLESHGIASGQVHARNDKHTCVRAFRRPLPNMDEIDKRMLCIPCGWWVEIEDLMHIVDTIQSGW